MKLTEKIISTLACEGGQKDRLAFDDQVQGLGVRISSSGRKNFLVQFRNPAGRKRRLALGAWGTITLEQARQASKIVLGQVAAGRDPFAERKTLKETALAETAGNQPSLYALLQQWSEIGLADRRESYRKEAIRAVSLAFASFLNRRADSLRRSDAVGVLDELVKVGKRPMAGRTLAYARACYSWALKRGKLEVNPFAGLPIQTVTMSRDRVLRDEEIGAIFNSCHSLGFPFGPFFQTLMLTAQRRDEVAGMRWSEISNDRVRWTIPAGRSKNGKAHDVHLGPAVRAITTALPRLEFSGFVFSTNGVTPISGFSKARERLDALVKISDDWRLHDFRRTCVTWLAGAGFNTAVADKILNHSTSTGLTTVAKTYQRAEFLPERRLALEAWSQHVMNCARASANYQPDSTEENGVSGNKLSGAT